MRILGREVFAAGSSPALDSWLDDMWHFPASAEAFDSGFSIEIESSTAAVPAHVLTADGWPGMWDTSHLKVGPDELWITQNGSGVHLELDDVRARLTLHGQPFDGWIALHVAITESLCASGLVRLHASAAAQTDRTMVFTGPSGRGKSTTLVRAVEQGWSPVAEDGCLVDPGSLRLFGFDRRLRLLPDAAASLGHVLADRSACVGPTGKTEIAFGDFASHQHEGLLTDIVYLDRRPGPTEWRPLPPAEAVSALFEATGLPSADSARSVLATAFGHMVQRVDTWRLVLGDSDPVIPPGPAHDP